MVRKELKGMKEYPETHQQGFITIENIPKEFRSLRIGYNKLMKDFKH